MYASDVICLSEILLAVVKLFVTAEISALIHQKWGKKCFLLKPKLISLKSFPKKTPFQIYHMTMWYDIIKHNSISLIYSIMSQYITLNWLLLEEKLTSEVFLVSTNNYFAAAQGYFCPQTLEFWNTFSELQSKLDRILSQRWLGSAP